MDSRPLDELQSLDREKLHLFVAGPGQGEGIAIALPERGWLLLDGCRVADSSPLQEIYRRWRTAEDTVEWMILTHPHRDHCEGFAAVLDAVKPERVAVAGVDPGPVLTDVLRSLYASGGPPVTSAELRRNAVRSAVVAIHQWAQANPGALVPIRQTSALPTSTSKTKLTVRSPEAGGLKQFCTDVGTSVAMLKRANDFSTVIEIEFGATRLVLGGDLPRFETSSKRPIATGWDQVMAHAPALGTHRGLKLPHHGAPEAFHPLLMTAAGAHPRHWVVTPFNCCGLPSLARMDGLGRLLKHEPAIYLSALPASRELQKPTADPGRARLSQLLPRMKASPTGVAILDRGVDIRSSGAPTLLAPVWVVAFDDNDQIAARWRGQWAIEVITDSKAKKAGPTKRRRRKKRKAARKKAR